MGVFKKTAACFLLMVMDSMRSLFVSRAFKIEISTCPRREQLVIVRQYATRDNANVLFPPDVS